MIRVLEVIGSLVFLTLLLLGAGSLWSRLFPKKTSLPAERPGKDKCCSTQGKYTNDA